MLSEEGVSRAVSGLSCDTKREPPHAPRWLLQGVGGVEVYVEVARRTFSTL